MPEACDFSAEHIDKPNRYSRFCGIMARGDEVRKVRYDQDCVTAAQGLRNWRREAELTQEQLAQACGVHRSTVIRWEDPSNDNSPGIVHLLRLCAYTGAIPEYLYRRITGGGVGE